MTDDNAVIREIFIDASPEEVFPYLTQSDKYVLWMGVSAELAALPAGVFRLNPNGREAILGEFLEVVPPKRVVFTWGWDEPGHPVPAGSTRVEIDLIPQGSGTLLRLVHRTVPDDFIERHDGGWQHYLARLKIAAEGGIPGPDPFAAPTHRHG